jgi:hypothetical protein
LGARPARPKSVLHHFCQCASRNFEARAMEMIGPQWFWYELRTDE